MAAHRPRMLALATAGDDLVHRLKTGRSQHDCGTLSLGIVVFNSSACHTIASYNRQDHVFVSVFSLLSSEPSPESSTSSRFLPVFSVSLTSVPLLALRLCKVAPITIELCHHDTFPRVDSNMDRGMVSSVREPAIIITTGFNLLIVGIRRLGPALPAHGKRIASSTPPLHRVAGLPKRAAPRS